MHTRHSPAKINLTLSVLGTSPDGFHILESLVAQLEFGDTISFAPRSDGQHVLHCEHSDVPTDDTNLVLRAAARISEVSGCERGVDIQLDKRIPPGSGLGGGSSNAATTLLALNDMWKLGLSDSQLTSIAAELGSDVPLFPHGPLSIIRGRGEMVQPVDQPLDAAVLLVLPGIHCSTPLVYQAYDRLPPQATDVDVQDVLSAASASEMMPLLFNDLEEAALDAVPEMASLAMCLRDILGEDVRMTGSGSAWFRLYDSEAEAKKAADVLREALPVPIEVTRLASTSA